jgi:hypothetical protein
MRNLRTLVLVAVATATVPAFAQTKPAHPDSAVIDEARQHFQRGVELYKEGSFDAALAEFSKAYEIAPDYRVLYNLAQVQNERHDYVAALRSFQQYLQQGGTEISADRRDQVNKEVLSLNSRVARLTVQTNVDGAELFVDGVSAGTLPSKDPVLVSAGVRQLQVKKPGFEDSSQTQTVAGGDDLHLELDLQVVPSAAPAAAAPAATSTSRDTLGESAPVAEEKRSMVPFWATVVSTTLLAGGAVTFGALTSNANSRLDTQLNTFPGNQQNINDARSELKRDALLTDIFTGAAVVSGGFCLYFGLTGGHAKPADTAASLRIGPAGPGVRMSGTF